MVSLPKITKIILPLEKINKDDNKTIKNNEKSTTSATKLLVKDELADSHDLIFYTGSES